MTAVDRPENNHDEIPLPASAEARALGCICPDLIEGQGVSVVNMECHLHGILWLLKENKGEVP